MIEKILRFYQGFLIIDITGNALELLINQLMRSGINLWNIERLCRDHFRARIRVEDFKLLRPLARRRRSRVRILGKKGLPFIFRKAGRRYLLLIGLLVFFSILYLGSSCLWYIEIEGLEELPAEEIYQLLNDYGVDIGDFKEGINLAELDKFIQLKKPEIIWVDSHWQGTRLIIEIVEKRSVQLTRPGNVYAAKDGLVQEIIVLRGQAAIQEGDTVTTGQPLIVAQNPGERARGVVRAYVWYEKEAEQSLLYKELTLTGRVRRRWGIKSSQGILWLGAVSPPFKHYRRVREIKTVPKWRNIVFPLELVKEEYQEISYYQEDISRNTAEFLAREKALKGILPEIPAGSVIEEIKTELIDTRDEMQKKALVRIRVLVKVEEDIAKEGAGDSR